MGIIKNYSEYINEAWEDVDDSLDKKVAGVAIIYDNKILLVHPTNASWQKPTEEVDWAGFLGPDEAYPKMTAFQRIILDRHLKL